MLGANTVMPAWVIAWCWGLKAGRSWASGPPCKLIMAGPALSWSGTPVKPAAQPQTVSCGERHERRLHQRAGGQRRMSVARDQVEVATSRLHSSRGLSGPSTATTAVEPSRLSRAPETTRPGTSGTARGAPVHVSTNSSSLRPSTFQTSSSSRPASSASRPS